MFLHVDGMIAADRQRWVQVTLGDQSAITRYSNFVDRGVMALTDLVAKGLPLVGSKAAADLVERVAKLDDFPARNIADGPGWNGEAYVMADGRVFGPEGSQDYIVGFQTETRRIGQKGTMETWKQVIEGLEGQNLVIFCVMAMFLPPLLRLTNRVGNFGFELCGERASGKSTAQLIAASVVGGVLDDGGHYWLSMDQTLHSLEDVMASHNDHPVVLDEANVFAGGTLPKERAEALKAAVFKMSGGASTGRRGVPQVSGKRLVYLTSANEPISKIIGKSAGARAATDRLMTLDLTLYDKVGVFSKVPPQYPSASAFADHFKQGVAENYGHAFPAFIERLVAARHTDEAAVRRRIEQLVALFQKKAKIDANSGPQARVSEAFGLAYAAAVLAQGFDVLPKNLRLGSATLAAFRLFMKSQPDGRPPLDRVRAMLTDPRVVHLPKGKPSTKKAATILEAGAWVRLDGDQEELWIMPKCGSKLFPDWAALMKTASFQAMMVAGDGTHRTVKRTLWEGGPIKRVIALRVPVA